MTLLSPSIFNVGRSMFNVPICLMILVSGLSSSQTLPDQDLRLELLPTGEKLLHWTGHPELTYFLQASPDLQDWTWAPNIEPGLNGPMSYEVDGPSAGGFYRLQYTDQAPAPGETVGSADYDGDGLTNLQEITPRPRPGGIVGYTNLKPNIQTNPLRKDTDGDGLDDKWEEDHGLDPTDDGSRDINNGPNGDPDGDGVNNLGEQQAKTDPKNGEDFPIQMYTAFRYAYGAGDTVQAEGSWGYYTSHTYWQPATSTQSYDNYFSLDILASKASATAFPLDPGPLAQGQPLLSTGVYSHCLTTSDGSLAEGKIEQKRIWIKAPAKPELQEYPFLKITEKRNPFGESPATTLSSEVVIMKIQPNQIFSDPFDLSVIPDSVSSFWMAASCRLIPIKINIHEPNKEPPSDGVLVKAGEKLVYEITNESLPPGISVTWDYKILRGDGFFEVWTAFGTGNKIEIATQSAGIFKIRAKIAIPGQESPKYLYYVRERDDPHGKDSAGTMNPKYKKGQIQFVGVTEGELQLGIVKKARSFLGSTAYSKSVSVVATPTLTAGIGSNKCNIFVYHMATNAGASIPLDVAGSPPRAFDWYDSKFPISGWAWLFSTDTVKPGAIVSRYMEGGSLEDIFLDWDVHIPHTSAHVGILDYDGAWINAGPRNVNRYPHISDAAYQEAHYRKANIPPP